MKNYKTTLLGVIGAIWLAIQPLFTTQGFDIKTDWKNLVGAAIVAALGFFAKDFNISGSNPPKPIGPTDKAI